MAITTIRTEPRYKDFYTNLNVKAGTTGRQKGDLYSLTDAEAVKTSIKNLILTDPGERFFNPRLGSGIRKSLFENISSDTEFMIKTMVEATIKNYEPRANLLQVFVTAIPDEHSYSVSILFSLINNPATQTLNLILNRVR